MTTTANASAENALAADLFRPLPARYDMLAEILSLRQNRRWRLELVRHVAASEPRSVLDVATGTAGVAIELTQQTRAAVTGIDISTAMLRRGNDRVKQLGLESRIQLREGRAEALPARFGGLPGGSTHAPCSRWRVFSSAAVRGGQWDAFWARASRATTSAGLYPESWRPGTRRA